MRLVVAEAWDGDDAVVMLAIRSSRRGRSLKAVLGEYDAISHGIPREERLVASISRLTAAGLVEADGGRFRLTAAGRALVRRTGRWWWRPLDHVEPLHQALRDVALPESVVTSPLPTGAYEGALQAYRRA